MLNLLLLFVFATIAPAAPDLSDRIQVSDVIGPREIKVIRSAGAREQFVTVGEMVFVGDELVTVKGQIVGLSAYDGSKWKVAPDSRLKLESRKPEKKGLFFWTMEIVKGAMWGEVPKRENEKDAFRLKVKTKHSAMGIRGTEYLMAGNDKLSTLDVLEGTVWWGKDPAFPPGSYKEVNAGQHAEMGADGKVVLHSSQGDKGALAKHYGLVPENAGETKVLHSPDECKAQGKGWKSADGSKVGECMNCKNVECTD